MTAAGTSSGTMMPSLRRRTCVETVQCRQPVYMALQSMHGLLVEPVHSHSNGMLHYMTHDDAWLQQGLGDDVEIVHVGTLTVEVDLMEQEVRGCRTDVKWRNLRTVVETRDTQHHASVAH